MRRAFLSFIVTAVALTSVVAVISRSPAAEPAGHVLPHPPVGPPEVRIVVSAKRLGTISRYLFGSNLLWPYDAEGAYDEDAGRFYPVFLDEVRSLGVTALRYPGGITSDSFQWTRAIGPLDKRLVNEPYGMQAATRSKVCCTLDGPAPSVVGPDEYGRLLTDIGAIGTITVNFDTGNAQQAADFVAYMTLPVSRHPSRDPGQPSYWAALRAKNGHRAPYDVPYWEVGNEQDGPGQFGWRAGRLVSMGPHRAQCGPHEVAVCLYAFGGTTALTHQLVGHFADTRPSASRSDGGPGQRFYVYFPPVVPKSQTVYVNGQPWRAVADLGRAGAGADVYQFDPGTGEILFGDGAHGAIPPRRAVITASYKSGPHDGFVEFYRAMKRANPHVHVCEAEEGNTLFQQVMGRVYPYDCVEFHQYAKPLDIRAPMLQYEEDLLSFPEAEGASLSELQGAIRRWSGRNIPVLLTEYGQLIVPMPVADLDFNLSLEEGLLVASQLRQWIVHDVPVAEKYLLNSTPFLGAGRQILTSYSNINEVGLSIDSAMIAGPGPRFTIEPTGEAVQLISRLAGAERLGCATVNDPVMKPYSGVGVPALEALAAETSSGPAILVINGSPTRAIKTEVDFDSLGHGANVWASVLDGPSPLAYNSDSQPRTVMTALQHWLVKAGADFLWTFPAHSVSLLQLPAPLADR